MADSAEHDGCRGALLGLAVGDALGTTLEFKAPGSFAPIDDIVGGGPLGLWPGEWTDDTSMALCLAGAWSSDARSIPLISSSSRRPGVVRSGAIRALFLHLELDG